VSWLNRTERGRRIETLLSEERGYAGPPAEVRESVAERMKATLGPEIAQVQLLDRRIVDPSHPRLRLVPRAVKPVFSSLLAYAPIALASLGAATVVSTVAYVNLPHATQERVRRLLLPIPVRPEPIPVRPEPIPAHPEPVEGRSSSPISPAPLIAPAAPTRALTLAGKNVRPEPSPVGTRPIPFRPEPVEGRSSSTPAVPARDLTLAEENSLLAQARADLLQGQGAKALQALTDHECRFPKGRMFEQREALTIQALVQTGRRYEAYWRAKRFRSLFPESLMLQIIQPALDNEDP
jgi:hypothetical protein